MVGGGKQIRLGVVSATSFLFFFTMRRLNCALLTVALFVQLPVLVWLVRQSVAQHRSSGRHTLRIESEDQQWRVASNANDIKGSDPSEMFKVKVVLVLER